MKIPESNYFVPIPPTVVPGLTTAKVSAPSSVVAGPPASSPDDARLDCLPKVGKCSDCRGDDAARSCLDCANFKKELGACGAPVPSWVGTPTIKEDEYEFWAHDCPLFRRGRPSFLKPGSRVEVLYEDPDPRWVPHEFLEWADGEGGAKRCQTCGASVPCTYFTARALEGEERVVVTVNYSRDLGKKWRPKRLRGREDF